MTRRSLTPPQQFLFLQRNPICAGEGTLNAKGLVWEYRVRPSLLSRAYLVRIELNRDSVPRAFVLEPDLEVLADGRRLPHIYRDPLRLCLYLPKSGEWHGSMRIDKTFVPWVATWLFYFEEWLASDDWKGGGEHPNVDDREVRRRRG
jgi:hypothetical protein